MPQTSESSPQIRTSPHGPPDPRPARGHAGLPPPARTPAGLRAPGFCARGQTRPTGQGSPRPGLAGCGAARLERTDPAGAGRRRRQGDGGPRAARVGPGRPERRGRRRRTHPSPRRARSPPPGGEERGSGGRRAGTASPPRGLLSGPAPRSPQPPAGSPRPDAARPAPAPPARRCPQRWPRGSPARRARPAGPCGRPGYLGGCWWLGSFPGGRGASGRGRGGRAQRERGGRGRPRPGQAAGRPSSCRRAGGSGGGSDDCSRGSLRIFLGLVQDGGAPCTGFPVTLAMGRTTKEGGRRMRAQLAEPGRGWRGPAGGHAPSSVLPSGLVATPPSPPLWSSRQKGRRKALPRKRSLVSSPPGGATAQVRVGPAVPLGLAGLGMLRWALLTILTVT